MRGTVAILIAYTPDSRWRNRAEFPIGRDQIVAFLKRKWARELDYRLIKALWTFADDRIAVRFAYEWHDDSGQWFRSYGNENWEFDESDRVPARGVRALRSTRLPAGRAGTFRLPRWAA